MTEVAATRKYPRPEQPRSTATSPANDGVEAEVFPDPRRSPTVPMLALAQITGDFADAPNVDERLDAARIHYHLVSPAATSPSRIPEGCSILFTAVHVNIEYEVFPVEDADDAYALKRSALQRIGHAAGIRWNPKFTRRTDNASHPHYCSFSAFGKVFLFDGQETYLQGSKEVDLRDGSEQAKQILEKNTNAAATGAAQLRHQRIHILSDCETKATLRAIRALGLRSTYSLEELKTPFIVTRLLWTGATEDPELRRLFALRRMDTMLGATRALYGEGPPLAPGPSAPLPVPPPSSGPGLHHPAKERNAAVGPPVLSALAPKGGTSAPSKLEPVIKFGNAKGTPFSQAKTDDLTWYAQRLKGQMQDPEKSRYRTRNDADFKAANQELARRGAPPRGAQRTAHDPEDY